MKFHPTHKRIPGQTLMILVIAASLHLSAAQVAWSGPIGPTPVDRISSDAKPVPDETLNQMRGGFAWGGMNFSFGIQSSTFVNGTLMVNTILQTVGKNLLIATGSNPLGNTVPTGISTQNTPSSPLSSLVNSSGNQKSGNLPQVIFSPIQNLSGNTTLQSSPNTMNGSYGVSVQIAPSGSVNVANLIAPTTFDNASGIISVLQNAASNLVIHNVVTMNATVSHVGAITHTIGLNNLLQSSRFLSR